MKGINTVCGLVGKDTSQVRPIILDNESGTWYGSRGFPELESVGGGQCLQLQLLEGQGITNRGN